jgi:acyl dehydratase
MLDKAHIGKTLGRITTEVEKGRLRFFAKATGETNPIYIDEAAAKAAGYRSLPVPPSYFFCLPMIDDPDPTSWVTGLGVNLQYVLHGEQSFEYFDMAFAGDSLTFESRVTDIYDKKGGALEFLVTESTCVNQLNKVVAKMKCTTVIRNPGAGKK